MKILFWLIGILLVAITAYATSFTGAFLTPGGVASDSNAIKLSNDTTGNLNSLTRDIGRVYFDTTLQTLVIDDGVSLVQAAATSIFFDDTFQIKNAGDNSKILEINLSNLSTSVTRTLAMANAAVDLADVNSNKISIDGHLDGGVNKHDATELDFEDVAVSGKNVSVGSVESAITDLDDIIDTLVAGTNYTETGSNVSGHLQGINTAIGGLATIALDNLASTNLNAELRTINGAVGAPSYSFTNMTDGGLYRDAASDELRISINGVDKFTLGDNQLEILDELLYADGSEGTIGHVLTSTSVTGQMNWAAIAADSGKADIDLNNLATTSINVDLLPSATDVRSFGSAALRWNIAFVNNYRVLSGSATQAVFSGGSLTGPQGQNVTSEIRIFNQTGTEVSRSFGIWSSDVSQANERASILYFGGGDNTDADGDGSAVIIGPGGGGANGLGGVVEFLPVAASGGAPPQIKFTSGVISKAFISVNLTADDTNITPTTSALNLSSNDVTPASRTFTLSQCANAGQELDIIFSDATDAAQYEDDSANGSGSGNARLEGNWEPASPDETLSLRCDASAIDWIETGRTNP